MPRVGSKGSMSYVLSVLYSHRTIWNFFDIFRTGPARTDCTPVQPGRCYRQSDGATVGVSPPHRQHLSNMKELKKQASMLKLLGGEVYFQQYEQKKELGRGKFGVVFQVQDKDNKRTYAAKHIKTRKKEQRERVIEEIAILKKFSNPHIIRLKNHSCQSDRIVDILFKVYKCV